MAWALAAWMRKPRRGRVQLRLALLERIVRLVREPRYRRLLLGAVRTYFTLTRAQKAEEDRLLESRRYEEVTEMVQAERDILTDLDKLAELDEIAEEMERRERLAAIRMKQADLLHVMTVKFGTIPDAIADRVRSLTDTETLDRLLERLIRARDLAAMGL